MTTPRQLPLSLPLRDTSTLETFVEPAATGLVATAKALLQAPGQLYIWGDRGCGSTHLLEAVTRAALDAGQNACLLSATEMLAADPAMLEGLEQFACLALDDIDLLAGHQAWEEGLFHLYNRLVAARHSFLCAARQPPSGAGFRLPDLASRLAAGPVYQLAPLDDAGRERLLVSRAAARGLEMPAELARYIAVRAPRTNIDVLDCLDRLDAAVWEQKRRLTLPFARDVLGWQGVTKV